MAAAAAVLVALALVPAAGSRPGAQSQAAQSQAEQALRGIADAQAEAKESQGRYGSYWLSSGDRTLEKLAHPIRTEGVADLRSIECPGGWVAAARIGDDVEVMSSMEDRVVRAESGEVVRPECMTPRSSRVHARRSGYFTADVGARGFSFRPARGGIRVPAELSHHAREELDE